MVATTKYHRSGPVVTVDVSHVKEWKVDGGASAGNAGGLNEPLGGFIFVCNNDTMREDLERQLFGLPQRYQDSVKAIQSGLPLFLYNYSTRSMHGVFEAASDGGFNIDPEAWEIKEARRMGRPVSRFPAQVRVRLREERPSLEEATFRSKVHYYDGPKFRLELTVPEAEELLKLFGTAVAPKTQKSADDPEGEWERVKVKSKGSAARVHRPQPTKRSSSPNPPSGRRRVGPPVNGSSASSNASQSSGHYSSNGDFGRGREARADAAQRWRSDPDCWSGSSSAGLSTSSWASHDEERPKKGAKENGVTCGEANGGVRAGEYLDPDDASTVTRCEQTNGLCENGSEGGSRADSDELNADCSGARSSVGGESQVGSQSPNRGGFSSYSAALKAGMTADVGSSGEGVDRNGGVEMGQVGGGRVGSGVNVGVPSRANADFVGDGSKVGSGKHTEAVGSRRSSANSEASGGGAQAGLGCHSAGDLVWLERKVGKSSTCWDGEAKAAESRSAWSESKACPGGTTAGPEGGNRAAAAAAADGGSVGGRTTEGGRASGNGPAGDSSGSGKKSPSGGGIVGEEAERGRKGSSSGQGRAGARDDAGVASVGAESAGKKIPWQGKDAILRRLLEPSSVSVGGSPTVAASSGQQTQSRVVDASTSVPETSSSARTSSQTQAGGENAGRVGAAVDAVRKGVSRSEEGCGTASSACQTKGEDEGPVSMATRPASEVGRDEGLSVAKERDEKAHLQRTQSPSPGDGPAVIQQRPSGQTFVPARISPPPLQSSQRQFQPDVVRHETAYRAIPRGLGEEEYGVQNGVVQQGGWGVASTVAVMSPGYLFDANGMFSLPPQQFLVNAEELHSEILEFAHTASPSAGARSCAEAAIECVRDAVKRLWASADVEVFGSYATGLCLSQSDVDVVVVDAPPPAETAETAGLSGTRLLAPSIRLLGAALRDYGWCKSIATIDSATMPVIKLQCRPGVGGVEGGAPVVKIDITIGGRKMSREGVGGAGQSGEGPESGRQVSSKYEAASKFHNGAAAREYVIKRLQQQPALAPLVLLLKSYLQSKGLKDVYTGGLGSFSLTIMLVFYLERIPIACGTPSEARAAGVAGSSDCVGSGSSAETAGSASALPGTESLDCGEEEASRSTAPSESVRSSDGRSALASGREGSSETGVSSGGRGSLAVEASKSGGCNPWTGGIVEQLLGSMHTVACPNLGTLLVGFLYVFGWAIDFTQVRLVTKGVGGSGGLFYLDKASGPVALTIDDPLRPGANIGAGSFNMHQVQGAMQEMFCILTRLAPVGASSERVGMGPGRRRALPLLDQLFANGNASLAPV